MNLVDDLKSSLGGSDSGSDSSSSFDSDLDSGRSGLDDSGFGDSGSGGDSFDQPATGNKRGESLDQRNPGSSPGGNRQRENNFSGQDSVQGTQGQQSNPSKGRNQGNRSGRNQGNQRNQGSSRERQGSGNHPNAQAGRPQEGSSKPQLSSQTQRKMENAGLRSNEDHTRASRGEKESVADSRDDLEELKSQNQQIIELLKRINRNLEQLGR